MSILPIRALCYKYPRHFSFRRHKNVISFPLPLSNLLSSPGIKSHPPSSTSKINFSSRPLFLPEISSPWTSQHLSPSTEFCSFLMNLLSVILLIQPTQYILVFNVLMNITLFLLNVSGTVIHYMERKKHILKLLFDCSLTYNFFNISCCINIDNLASFSKLLF